MYYHQELDESLEYSMEFDVAHWLSILVRNDDSYSCLSLVSDPIADGMVPFN